jgi:hypothetical protein
LQQKMLSLDVRHRPRLPEPNTVELIPVGEVGKDPDHPLTRHEGVEVPVAGLVPHDRLTVGARIQTAQRGLPQLPALPVEGPIDIATMWFLRGLGVLLLSTVVAMLIFGLAPHELDGVKASYSGIPGTVDDIQCTMQDDCHADFIGDDGTRITDVKLNGLSRSRPTYSRARVSSPQATAAWPDSRLNGIGLVVIPLVLMVLGWTFLRRNAAPTTSRHRRPSET